MDAIFFFSSKAKLSQTKTPVIDWKSLSRWLEEAANYCSENKRVMGELCGKDEKTVRKDSKKSAGMFYN